MAGATGYFGDGMSATRLLVLGVVRTHGCAHGYRVGQELLAWQADKWANTKTGSIYHALRQLTKEGLLSASETAASETGPPRTDYAITPAGDAEFLRLLERALKLPEPRPDMLCAGLAFLSALSRATAIDCLRGRLTLLRSRGTVAPEAEDGDTAPGSEAPILPPHGDALRDFWTHHSISNQKWVETLIQRIEAGAYRFADEDGSPGGSPSFRSD